MRRPPDHLHRRRQEVASDADETMVAMAIISDTDQARATAGASAYPYLSSLQGVGTGMADLIGK